MRERAREREREREGGGGGRGGGERDRELKHRSSHSVRGGRASARIPLPGFRSLGVVRVSGLS
jgi:hypothetical protein